MKKRILVILLAVCMTLQLFGCGQKKETVQGQQSSSEQELPETGRYVESEITLPEEIDSENIVQIGKKEDKLCIYVKKENGDEVKIVSYLYQDGEFEVHTPAWLESLSFAKDQLNDYSPIKVIENAAGKSFLFCALMSGENTIGHLYCSEDGLEAKEVTPADWLEEDPDYHYYDVPSDVAVLENGTVVANFVYIIKTYNSDTFEKINEVQLQTMHLEKIIVDKNNFDLIAMTDDYSFMGIEVYNQNCEVENTISPTDFSSSSCALDILSDGSFIMGTKPGLYKVQVDGTMKLLVDGIYTSFALEDRWCVGFAAMDSGNYYGLFAGDGDVRFIMEYKYDPNISNIPDTTLTVYTVYDNRALSQAAASFTKQNPGVMVKVEVGISDNNMENADLSTVLQGVNAKLMNNEGSDIMLLDGMDKDSLIEKNVLADISDVIKPLIDDGTLLPNILNNYVTDSGAVYTVPLKFSMNMILGSKVDVSQVTTVKSLAEVAASHQDSLMGARTVNDLTCELVPYMVSDIVKGKELDKEALKEGLENLKVIADNCGIVADYGEDYRAKSYFEMANDVSVAFYDTQGFLASIYGIGVVQYVNGSFTAFENAYAPIGEIAINKATENMNVAKEFVKFALSYEIQDTDSYDGFSVNTKALDHQITIDRSGYGFCTDIEIGDGQYAPFEVSEVTPENRQKMLDLCKVVSKPVVNDPQILKVITEELPKYLDGSSTIDETITQIEKGLNMYLAE